MCQTPRAAFGSPRPTAKLEVDIPEGVKLATSRKRPHSPEVRPNECLRELAQARIAREGASARAAGGSGDRTGMPAVKGSLAAAASLACQGRPSSWVDGTIKLLSWNVWFSELYQAERMAAIGQVIAEREPHVVCLQEVTTPIYHTFAQQRWWADYVPSRGPADPRLQLDSYYVLLLVHKAMEAGPSLRESSGGAPRATSAGNRPSFPFSCQPFANSIMGRELVSTTVCPPGALGAPLRVATTHLESPLGFDQLMSEPRKAQAAECMRRLSGGADACANTVLAGDMNFTEKNDGAFPLHAGGDGWVDAWAELRPGEVGYTYDGITNPMLGSHLRSRLDRLICRLEDYQLTSVETLGREPLPRLKWTKTVRGREKEMQVLPSDHFGLLLEIQQK
eukprot:jgi/Mesvir1/7800/Mv11742-RA.1